MAEEEKSLKEMMQDMRDKLNRLDEKKVVQKDFKLPFFTKVGMGNARIKKNWAYFQILNENGSQKIVKAQIEDGTVIIDGFPRIATTEYCYMYKGKPWYIIPSYSLQPILPRGVYTDAEKQNMNIGGRRLILARMQKEVIKPKSQINMKGWIILLLVLAGVGYYLMKGGKLW